MACKITESQRKTEHLRPPTVQSRSNVSVGLKDDADLNPLLVLE